MIRIILYSTLLIALISSCSKEDIEPSHYLGFSTEIPQSGGTMHKVYHNDIYWIDYKEDCIYWSEGYESDIIKHSYSTWTIPPDIIGGFMDTWEGEFEILDEPTGYVFVRNEARGRQKFCYNK